MHLACQDLVWMSEHRNGFACHGKMNGQPPPPLASLTDWSWQPLPACKSSGLPHWHVGAGRSSQMILQSINASPRRAPKFISVCLLVITNVCVVCCPTRLADRRGPTRAWRAPKPWLSGNGSFKQTFNLWLEMVSLSGVQVLKV